MKLHVTTGLALLLAMMAVPAGFAHAASACQQGIEQLSPSIADVKDEHTRAVLQNDLKDAQKEATEEDDDECAEVLHHAQKVLHTAK